MSVRRSSVFGGSKRLLKEKIVQIYESFFRGEDLTRHNPNFWSEFFLLKPKVALLEAEILKLSGDELMSLKPNINILFAECVKTLDHEHAIRVVYALQTLCALISSVCKKTSGECGFDVINILIGFDVAEQQMQALLKHCSKFLTGDFPHSLACLCLKLLLVIVTGSDNISQNSLLEYLIIHSMFDVLVQLLCNPESRAIHGSDVLLLISLLVNYRKYELSNPYIVKLSILDNELALNGYGQVLTGALSELCHQSETDETEIQASWLSSITNMVGLMFGTEGDYSRMQQVNCNTGALIALYEVVHLNRNFMTTLAHIQTDVKVGSFPQDDSNAGLEQSTLLVTFFQYCSIVMQDPKCANSTKLCFIILSCIAEDQYANFYMHDSNLMFKVILYRLPMRHRKITLDSQPQTLAATLVDLIVEFIMSHMMNKFPLELFLLAIGIIHRILCYQKKSRVRLNYQWKNLWSALISLLKFLTLHKAQFAKKYDIFSLGSQVCCLYQELLTSHTLKVAQCQRSKWMFLEKKSVVKHNFVSMPCQQNMCELTLKAIQPKLEVNCPLEK
ncbi:unnamed protein product [Bemisia tabaci]|uniref:Armadillo-like helical domain-containing protein n=1 Tax=Bemisia tabaci TaxID=7038 RepID=A0A9P0AH98_BEMTA|nr:unnamed protein product [Bemisia tabaci]